MFYKKWPNWLKGGIILGAIVSILFLLFFGTMWFQAYVRHYPPVYGLNVLPTGGSECYVYEWITGKTNEVIKYGYINGRETLATECTGILTLHIFLITFFTFIGFLIGSVIGFVWGLFVKRKRSVAG